MIGESTSGIEINVSDGLFSSVEDKEINQRCAETIRQYWIGRGFATIQAMVGMDKHGHRTIVSNMVNGVPPVVRGMENVVRPYRA